MSGVMPASTLGSRSARLAACVLAAAVIGGSDVAKAQTTPAPEIENCGILREIIESRFTDQQIGNQYWGSFVDAGTGLVNFSTPFPPVDPNGAQAFRSLCGTSNMPGWPGPSFVGFGVVATGDYKENGFWVTPQLTDCEELWRPRYALNLDMRFGPAAGDYPPKHLDLARSTSPLVSQSGTGYGWPTALPTRPVLGQSVDLITGVPLLETSDFELPMGSATFRFMRTYSEYPHHTEHEAEGCRTTEYWGGRIRDFNPQAHWWDWAGQGWMLGVAPLLLIDSSYWGISEAPTANHTEKRCYFLPDAHQAVPFMLLAEGSSSPSSRTYTAPPRFDAVLTHDGAGNAAGWTTMPTKWYVWTHRRSIKYTFSPVYTDTGPEVTPGTNEWTTGVDNEHAAAGAAMTWPGCFPNSGESFGTPHYAVVTAIDDLHGNRVEFEYAPFERVSLADLGGGIHEIGQKAQQKGQINRIKLLTGVDPSQPSGPNNGTVVWTIIPVYRSFGGSATTYFDLGQSSSIFDSRETGLWSVLGEADQPMRFENQRAIDSVFVYRGDVALPSGMGASLTLDHQWFVNVGLTLPAFHPESTKAEASMLAALATIRDRDVRAEMGLDADWEYRVKYIYADNTRTFERAWGALSFTEGHPCPMLMSPRLLCASTTRRSVVASEEVETTSHTLYRYRLQLAGTETGRQPGDIWRLNALWGPSRLAALHAEMIKRGAPTTSDVEFSFLDEWPLALLAMPDSVDELPVPGVEATDEPRVSTFVGYADQVWQHWNNRDTGFSSTPAASSGTVFHGSEFQLEMLHSNVLPTIGGANAAPVALLSRDGTAMYADRTGSADGTYTRVYRFLIANGNELSASEIPDEAHPLITNTQGRYILDTHIEIQRALFHHPYRILSSGIGITQRTIAGSGYTPGLGAPMWAAVIDTHSSWDGAARKVSGQSPSGPAWDSIAQLQAFSPTDPRKAHIPTTRRLVIMNGAGYVMHDRTWTISVNGSGQEPLMSSGLWEERLYDWNENPPTTQLGRLKQVRSYGWSAAAQAEIGDTDGLITVYEYDTRTAFAESLEVSAIGVKKGTQGATGWKRQFVRDTERTDLVRYEIEFDQPPTALFPWDTVMTQSAIQSPGAGVRIAVRGYDLEAPPPPPAGQPADPNEAKRVTREYTIKPPVPNQLGTLYFPVEITFRDDAKQPYIDQWRGYGAFSDVTALLSGGTVNTAFAQNFYTDLRRTDGEGREVLTAVDFAGIPSLPSRLEPVAGYGGTTTPTRPPGWTRVSAGAALEQWVVSEYTVQGLARRENNVHMGEWHLYSQGYRDEHPWQDALWDIKQSYTGLTFDPATGAVIGVGAPGMLEYTWPICNVAASGGGMFGNGPSQAWSPQCRIYKVNWDVNWAPGAGGTPSLGDEYSVISSLHYEMETAGQPTKVTISTGSDNRTAEAAYTDLGETQRQRFPDGTLIRNVYDPFGKLLRVYRGTDDRHWYWGTMVAPVDPCEPPSNDPPTDNLVLVEKRAYGDSVNDAMQLISTRTYRDKPNDIYGSCISTTSNEDSIGWRTELKYDWRMRQVMAVHYGEGGASAPVLRHTVTYLDHLDRVRFTATFGATAPTGAANPRTVGPESNVPSAATILAAGPLQLSETVYNLRGLVEEQREYDVTSAAAPAYTCTKTFYDFADRPIVVVHSSGREDRTEFNAAGQQVSTSTWAGGVEVSKSMNIYDQDTCLVIKTIDTERVNGATGTTLDASNSVSRHGYRWYDDQKRLIATADLGTGTLALSASDPLYDAYTDVPSTPGLPARGQAPIPTFNGSGPNPTGINRHSLPDWVRITCYQYDDQGREAVVVHPDARVTRKYYNGFGEIEKLVENADDSDPRHRRTTHYKYDQGRLVKIGGRQGDDGVTDPQWDQLNGEIQITQLIYGDPASSEEGAEILDSSGNSFTPKNYNGGLVSEVRFPDSATGQPSATDTLSFKYYITGEIAQRTDQRGVVVKYFYDESGRAVRATIDAPPAAIPPLTAPVEVVRQVNFAYDELGNLIKATAWRQTWNGPAPPASTEIIAETVFDHDHHGNLILDRQQHGTTASASSPQLNYTWDWQPWSSSNSAANYNRLVSITYPDKDPSAATLRRVLSFEYGTNSAQSAVDHALSRITGITSTGGFGSAAVARYEYSGVGRRVETRFHHTHTTGDSAVVQLLRTSSFQGVGLDGADSFGRLRDLHYTNNAGGTLYRAASTFDQADNRTSSRVTQAAWSGAGRDNIRSFAWGYDGLNRLIESDTGRLDSGAIAATSPLPILSDWTLDRLGNWTGDETNPGRSLEGDLAGTGVFSTRAVTHAVDMTNGIGSIDVDTGSGPTQTLVHHDAAGNLISDGVYVYQYDGLNRLSKVSQIGSLACSSGTWSGTAGPWVIQYSYDGLGRLARAQRPWPAPSLTETRVRTEHFYYDGVRRIQEEFTDPLELVNPGGGGEGIDSGDEEGGQGDLPTTVTWVEREYIWSAAVGAGVDELVCQVAPTGTSWATERIHYALTESTGTVVGLADPAGVAKAQYHWDPYGELLAVDLAAGVPRNRVGHQGLFMDRLDIGTQHEQLVRGADVLAQNRNRTYAPALGRFLQRDPNQSGVMTALGDRGAGLPAAALSVQGMYGDGASLYGYTRGNPVTWTDPQGTIGFISGMMTGLDIADSSMDAMEQTYGGVSQFMGVYSMMQDYLDDQEQDVLWALDWSQDDLSHSKAGKAGALLLGAKLARLKGTQEHHIAVHEGTSGDKNRTLFESAGLSIHGEYNKVPIPHGGRHSSDYKLWIYAELQDSVEGIKGTEARKAAMLKRLGELKKFIKKNPEVVYNTVKGNATGWKGRRSVGIWRR